MNLESLLDEILVLQSAFQGDRRSSENYRMELKKILCKAFEAFALNRSEMHEDIRGAIFRRDEAKSLGVIEPLHFAFCTHC